MDFFSTVTIPTINQLIIAVIILAVAYIISAVIMRLLKKSKRLTARTETTLDDTIVHLLSRPIHIGFQIAAIIIALWYLFPELHYQDFSYSALAFILLIFWVAYAVNRVVLGVLEWHEAESQKDSDAPVKRGTFGFLNTLISVLIYGIALAFILDHVGVDISALLAGLGIAGIAVALALQKTLSGVFSAVYLAIDKPIRQGDYVSLDGGTEGFVEDISLRSTRIKTFSNNIVIVPNNKITDMVMTNYYLPSTEFVLKVPFGVSYASDLKKVEKVAIKTASSVLKTLGASGEKEPFVRFYEFGDSAIEAKVVIPIRNFLDQYVIKHEIVKALHEEFAKADIEIPYPQMDVHVDK